MNWNNARSLRLNGCLFAEVMGVIALSLMGASAWASEPLGRVPVPGELAVKLTLLCKDGAISAKEPLLARVEITNKTHDDIQLLSCSYFGINPSWEIRDDQGIIVATTSPLPGAVRSDDVTEQSTLLSAGATTSSIWIVSGLYHFGRPGRYNVRVSHLIPALPEPLAIASDDKAVRVLPFDKARLTARCEEIYLPLKGQGALGDMDIDLRTRALYSVQDDVVVPHMEWLIKTWAAPYAAWHLGRLHTPLADAALTRLGSYSDRVREVLVKMPGMPAKVGNDWAMGR